MGLPPRTTVDRVIIVVKPDGDELKFRIVVPAWVGHACSPIVTVKAGPSDWNGNSCLLYGPAITDYLGQDYMDVSISVSLCTSGEL